MAAPSDAPADRCGFVMDVPGVGDLGAACCWRPTWENTSRCVWHAPGQKSAAALADAVPRVGDRLDGATLRGAALSDASWLAGATLAGADFSDASLRGADLSGANLRRASFRDADASGASFRDADLEDAYFVGTDLRDADLTGAWLYRAALGDARVNQGTAFGDEVVYEREFRRDPDRPRAAADSALWVYSELDRVFDANAVPERALDYYVRERDLRRRVAWRLGEHATALRLEGSRWVMHYGTSPARVLASSVVLIAVSAVVFPFTGGLLQTGPGEAVRVEYGASPLGWPGIAFKSLYFSAITFATLGYGDIQPVGSVARAVAAVESILGSVLMALLVFVLTRRVG